MSVPLAEVELVSLAALEPVSLAALARCGVCSIVGLLALDGCGLSTSLLVSSSPSATKRKSFEAKYCVHNVYHYHQSLCLTNHLLG